MFNNVDTLRSCYFKMFELLRCCYFKIYISWGFQEMFPLQQCLKKALLILTSLSVYWSYWQPAGGGKINVCRVWESSFVDLSIDILIFCGKFFIIVSSCSSIIARERKKYHEKEGKRKYLRKLCRCEKAVCMKVFFLGFSKGHNLPFSG